MNQTSVTYLQDVEFARLLSHKKFGGSDGALSYFQGVYESSMNQSMLRGDFFLTRKCTDLHLEAFLFYSGGSFFKSRYASFLASRASHLADILKEKIPSDELTSEDCYLWVASGVALIEANMTSLFGRVKVAHHKIEQLQVSAAETLSRLDFLFKKEHPKTEISTVGEESVWSLYTPSNHFLSSKYPDLLSVTVLCQHKIRVEMMLYKLCIEGLHTLPDECITRERLFAYAMFHEKSLNITILKIVSEIFQLLSNHEDMKKVKARISHFESVQAA